MLIEKEIHPGFRNARFLMIFGAITGISIYFLLFIDKLIIIITDAQNVNIGGSFYEGLSYFYYILYGILLAAFILILVAQIYNYSFLSPETKIASIASTIFIGLFVILMVLFIIPNKYINILLFGPDDSNQGFFEVGALLTVGNHPNKIAGDNIVHAIIFYLTIITVIISFYLINYTYYKTKQSFGLRKKMVFISPIFLIISWINHQIISGNGAILYDSLSSTEKSMMIYYFLYLTAEALIYLSYIGIFVELFVRFYKLKSTPTKSLIINETKLTKTSL
jgi:hypothetical protein